jgi:hypothetical protein
VTGVQTCALPIYGGDGSVVFPRCTHPALKGIQGNDLCLWGNDQVAYHWAFQRSARWPLLVESSSGGGMDLAPVIETSWGKGHYLISSLLIGSKLGQELMAEKLLANFLNYLMGLPKTNGTIACFLPSNSPATCVLKEESIPLRLLKSNVGALDLDSALEEETAAILMPGNVQSVSNLLDWGKNLGEYTAKGGWVVLIGLEAAALPVLSKVIGEELRLQGVEIERVWVSRPDDPIMAGIGNQEFYWEVAEKDEDGRIHTSLIGPVFSGAIVYDDVNPLSRRYGADEALRHRLSHHMTSEDPGTSNTDCPFHTNTPIV